MSRLLWYLRQLFPSTYRTFYRDAEGRRHFVVWRMWLGRSFQVTDVVVDTMCVTHEFKVSAIDGRGVGRFLEEHGDELARQFRRAKQLRPEVT